MSVQIVRLPLWQCVGLICSSCKHKGYALQIGATTPEGALPGTAAHCPNCLIPLLDSGYTFESRAILTSVTKGFEQHFSYCGANGCKLQTCKCSDSYNWIVAPHRTLSVGNTLVTGMKWLAVCFKCVEYLSVRPVYDGDYRGIDTVHCESCNEVCEPYLKIFGDDRLVRLHAKMFKAVKLMCVNF